MSMSIIEMLKEQERKLFHKEWVEFLNDLSVVKEAEAFLEEIKKQKEQELNERLQALDAFAAA